MGAFYSGAYSQPLQRQSVLGSGVDPSGIDASGGYAVPATAPSLGQPTSKPSRFQSILGSLSQWNQPTGQRPTQGVVGGLANLGKSTGLFTL